MTKKAIDIALLLPNEVRQQATRINQQLNTSEIDFAQPDIFPHITLLMGCLVETDRTRAEALLAETAQEADPLPLQITRIVNKGSVSFEIGHSDALQHLHARLIKKFKPYLSYEASPDFFYKPSEVKEDAVNYVSNFLDQASHENFWPHITLGYGDYPQEETADISFTASQLALCHLGKHCTCREILREVRLGK
jgi:2'-5' RNA ligase